MPAAEPPEWIRDAVGRSAAEVRSFVRTGALFTARPGKFAREWAEGRLRALNPLGVLATGAAVLAVARALLDWVVSRSAPEGGVWKQLADAVAPFIHYAVLGLLCHAVLRVLGSRRKLSDSLAISLFAGGGPGVLTPIVVYLSGAVLWMASGRPDVIASGLLGSLPHGAARVLLWVSLAGYALFL